ncbi:MAG: nucleoside hydrolase [Chloroflexia bacterium]|nr:nucleoside hydrolase [Chloroflexia bacterium]
MAILMAFASPEVQIEGLSAVFGNTGVEVTTTNAMRLVELAGQPDIPVAAGAEKPLLRPFTGKGWHVHGKNGLGEVDFPEPTVKPDPRRAPQLIIDTIMANPGEITLVPLGPLTNIALAVATEPRIAENVKEVVLMGGAATVPGNASPAAEANIRNDPEAAHIVFHAGWPLTMIGLDVTEKSVMTQDYMDRLRAANNRWTDFIYAITKHYLEFYRSLGIDGMPVHDSSALAYVIDPTLFETKHVYTDVDHQSEHHHGQTIPDWRGQREREPNVNVAVDVDSERFLDLYGRRLSEARV